MSSRSRFSGVVLLIVACASWAQQPVVYPAKGQGAAQAQANQSLDTWRRAVNACMEGRGYVIK